MNANLTVNPSLTALDTPSVLVDLDLLEANIRQAQQQADDAGVKLRPHSKSHECAQIVQMQLDAGAIGVSSAKLEEAMLMAEHGVKDIQIVHPFYGNHKLAKLEQLIARADLKLTCTVDMLEHAVALGKVGTAAAQDIAVLLKIDTGVQRFGVPPGAPALQRAVELQRVPGIKLVGIMSHESTHGERTSEGVDRLCRHVAVEVSDTAALFEEHGIELEHVAIGSTTALRNVAMLKEFPRVTEIHPGMYAFGDVMYVSNFAMPLQRCALSVLSMVIGVSDGPPPHAMIDAGAKTLSPDALVHLRDEPGYAYQGRPSFGKVKGRADLWLGRLAAENGILYFKEPDRRVSLGERLQIIPNNATMVVVLHDQIYGIRNGQVETTFKITGRGAGN
jgi:D-serine deaminase-like pyridoxal phosphate-dependent protein